MHGTLPFSVSRFGLSSRIFPAVLVPRRGIALKTYIIGSNGIFNVGNRGNNFLCRRGPTLHFNKHEENSKSSGAKATLARAFFVYILRYKIAPVSPAPQFPVDVAPKNLVSHAIVLRMIKLVLL